MSKSVEEAVFYREPGCVGSSHSGSSTRGESEGAWETARKCSLTDS